MNVEHASERVRAEFEEMPGMTLTMPQASRLFGLERESLPDDRRAVSSRRRLSEMDEVRGGHPRDSLIDLDG